MLQKVKPVEDRFVNGLNVSEFERIVDAVRAEPALAKFQFRAANAWIDGGLNRTAISSFYAAGGEQGEADRRFRVDAGEPAALLGKDEAPNPAEYLLHALAACLTSSIVYKAAARGIVVESIESRLEGDLDGRRFLELADTGRTGFQQIRARFKVKANATPEEIRALAEFSPVYDTLTRGSPVSIDVERA